MAPGTVKVPQGATDVETIIDSYDHPHLTINHIDDHTAWVKGSSPQPLDTCELWWVRYKPRVGDKSR